MTQDEALAYFTPHPLTKGPVMLDPEKMRAAVAVLREGVAALRWYVENDDVVEDLPGNEFWTAGRDRARALLGDAPQSNGPKVFDYITARPQP